MPLSFDPLLWCDCETLGLDEREHAMLELGLVLTDRRLEVTATFEAVVGIPGVRALPAEPEARAMHERSGLLDAVERSPLTLRQVEERALAWVDAHQARGRYMAGSGVGFDRRWLRHYAPRLERAWHYRNFDLTTLRRYFGEEKRESPHRALPDLLINVDDMRRYAAARAALREAVAVA